MLHVSGDQIHLKKLTIFLLIMIGGFIILGYRVPAHGNTVEPHGNTVEQRYKQ